MFCHYKNNYHVFVYTNHFSIKYLINKPIITRKINRWLLFLLKFHITIAEKLGRDQNVIANFLSRLTNDGGIVLVKYVFPNGHLFVLSISTLLSIDIANYLIVGKFSKYLPSKEWKSIVK